MSSASRAEPNDFLDFKSSIGIDGKLTEIKTELVRTLFGNTKRS